MKVLVLGDGLLGSEIIKQTGWEYVSRKKDGFDATSVVNLNPYVFESYYGLAFSKKYDIILNCIANTNTYSDDKKSHWNINYMFVNQLINYCNKNNLKLIHISTDYVYTNSIDNASEDDVPVHLNSWYAYTKLLADALIELHSNNYLICRCTHKPNPFPYENAWINQIGNFDYVDVIAKLIIELIESNSQGIYNVGTELKSMFELASRTKTVTPLLKDNKFPANTTMNLKKLNESRRTNK